MNITKRNGKSDQHLDDLRRVGSCLLLVLFCLTFAGCGGRRLEVKHVGGVVTWQCAPFARAITGVNLHGAAAGWWSQADGRYERTQVPRVGKILVFQAAAHMPSGHVAVVAAVVSQRRILVTHANWVPHVVTEDQPVEDVSDAGDWSLVKVWWPATAQLGSTRFQTFGFISPDRPVDRSTLAANTLAAIRAAPGGG